MLAFAGGAPWVATAAGAFARLDPSTLTIRSTFRAPDRIVAIAGTRDRLWVAGGRSIEEVDPFSGQVIHEISEPARIHRLVASPDGSLLYIALAAPVRHDQVPVLELQPSTGVVAARTYSGTADLGGVGELTPTASGVWIVFATGMMGEAVFARASDLRQWTGEVGQSHGPVEGTNAMRVWWAGGVLWASGGAGGLFCVDPSNGRELGFVVDRRHNPGGVFGGVVSTGDQVYVGTEHSIARIDAPAPCILGS